MPHTARLHCHVLPVTHPFPVPGVDTLIVVAQVTHLFIRGLSEGTQLQQLDEPEGVGLGPLRLRR